MPLDVRSVARPRSIRLARRIGMPHPSRAAALSSLLVLLLAAWAPAATPPSPAPPQAAPAQPAAPAQSPPTTSAAPAATTAGNAAEWERVKQAARQEGRVVVTGPGFPGLRNALVE